MGLKEFFWPSWRKIILFGVIGLISYFLVSVLPPAGICSHAGGGEVDCEITDYSRIVVRTILSNPLSFTESFYPEFTLSPPISYAIVMWVISLVWKYFLACLIIHLYRIKSANTSNAHGSLPG